MTTDENLVQVNFRIEKALLAEVDSRIAQTNARRARSGQTKITRNEWFVNMSQWVINELPHQAVKANLISAWPGLPEEALGVEK